MPMVCEDLTARESLLFGAFSHERLSLVSRTRNNLISLKIAELEALMHRAEGESISLISRAIRNGAVSDHVLVSVLWYVGPAYACAQVLSEMRVVEMLVARRTILTFSRSLLQLTSLHDSSLATNAWDPVLELYQKLPPPKPFFEPFLKSLQSLDVYGLLSVNPQHAMGLLRLIEVRGGLEKVNTPGLAAVIS
jgi:hypothetical protein